MSDSDFGSELSGLNDGLARKLPHDPGHGIGDDIGQGWLQTPFSLETPDWSRLESQDLYLALCESSGVGKAILDEHGNLLNISSSLLNLLGYTKTERQNQSLLELLADDESGRLAFFIQELLSGRLASYQAGKKLRHREGQTLHVGLHLVRLTEPGSALNELQALLEASGGALFFERQGQAEICRIRL